MRLGKVLKMEDVVLQKINERLEALEIVHTRYRGPEGRRGEKGDPGPVGRDGKDSTELRDLRAERSAFKEELYALDRKSTRLNSSHTVISYAGFCLQKKNRS